MNENEIIVKVEQQPGVVKWNFEELKTWLNGKLDYYRNTLYTDDNIGTAKTDVAFLRKMSKDINARRIEVKNKCLEPYEIIEKQAKELTDLIEEPISEIDKQVKNYEKRRKEKVRAEVLTKWQKASVTIPEEIRDKVYQKNYDSRWENITATQKSWMEAIDKIVEDTTGAIETIKSLKSEFEADGLKVYYDTLNLQKAIQKMNELKEQQERFRKMEEERRQREEQERIAREVAEKAAREAQERVKAEQMTNTTTAEPETQEKASEATNQAETIETTPVLEQTEIQKAPETVAPTANPNTRRTVLLEISGTACQIDKIQKYIAFTGAIFTEV